MPPAGLSAAGGQPGLSLRLSRGGAGWARVAAVPRRAGGRVPNVERLAGRRLAPPRDGPGGAGA